DTWSFDIPEVSDTCNGTNVVLTVLQTTTNALCGSTFAATRTWLGTDACGNTNSCAQTITVVDITPPVLVVTNRTVECGDTWTFDLPDAQGGCGGNVALTVLDTTTNNLCGNTLIATRLWLGTDDCGN